MQNDSLANRILKVAVGLVLLATIGRVWLGRWDGSLAAQAQIPDAGTQRRELVTEVRRLHAGLDRIRSLLETHTFKVTVKGADKSRNLRAPKAAKRPAEDS